MKIASKISHIKCLIALSFMIINSSYSQPAMQLINHFGGNLQDEGRSIITDSEGNYIFSGNFSKSIIFNDTTLYAYGENDFIFGKMDFKGNILWVRQIGGYFNYINGNSKIEIDDLDNIYIYTSNVYSSNLGDIVAGNRLILKYSRNGERLFILEILAGEIYDFHEKFNSIYLTGTDCQIKNGVDTIRILDNFILNLSNDGNYNWHKVINKKYFKFEIDKDSLIYLISEIFLDSTTVTNSPTRIYIDKADKFGNLKLSRVFEGTSFSGISDMTLNNESIFLTGYFFGSLNFGLNLINGLADCFVVRMDNALNVKYAHKIPNYSMGVGHLSIIANNTNCYFANNLIGYYNGSSLIKSNGAYDNFVVELDSLGNEVWYIQFGGASSFFPSDVVGDISITPQDKLLFAGSFSGQISINGKLILSTSINYEDMLFLQFDISSLINSDSVMDDNILAYPNPCSNVLYFSNSKYTSLKIYNLTGKLIFQSQNGDLINNIDMSTFQEGFYIYQIINNYNKILQEGKILHLK